MSATVEFLPTTALIEVNCLPMNLQWVVSGTTQNFECY